jgi:plasmid replication initiation protein
MITPIASIRGLDLHHAPAKPTARRPLRELRALLTDGWDLVQPIFVRPQWRDEHQMALHFVLQRDRATQLLTLPQTRALLRFVRQHAWRVQGR